MLTPQLKTILDLKDEAFGAISADTDCVPFHRAVKGTAKFNLGNFRFDLTIPQALVVRRPRGWISPALWQDGVPAAYVNYNVNHCRSFAKSGSITDQSYLGIQGGINLLGWGHSPQWFKRV